MRCLIQSLKIYPCQYERQPFQTSIVPPSGASSVSGVATENKQTDSADMEHSLRLMRLG